jgi:hypothetical protein
MQQHEMEELKKDYEQAQEDKKELVAVVRRLQSSLRKKRRVLKLLGVKIDSKELDKVITALSNPDIF